MIKTLGNPENKRYTGDTAGLRKLESQGMRLTYSVCDMVSDVVYAPRSKRDPMPWAQVGGLESRLRSTEIVAVEEDPDVKPVNVIDSQDAVNRKEVGVKPSPRYVVQPYGRRRSTDRRSRFAVYDTVTELDVDNYTSRYAAQDKADRLNASGHSVEEIREASRHGETVALHQAACLPKCVHGRHLYKTLRAKSIPVCAEGATYGVWDDNDAGFVHAEDCAQDAVTWAAEQMDDEPDYELEILAVCREHTDQPANGCEECDA